MECDYCYNQALPGLRECEDNHRKEKIAPDDFEICMQRKCTKTPVEGAYFCKDHVANEKTKE